MANAMYMGSGAMPGFPASSAPTAPIRPVNEPAVGGNQPAPPPPPNQVGPIATRPSGSSGGYDASYLQNLAGFIGSLFSKPAGTGNVTSFNPLGNLNEVSPPSGEMGNAPGAGAPLTWLQQALNGGGFSFGSPTPATGTTAQRGPAAGGGGGINRGPRQNLL